jgi:hypothetical protein
MLGAYAILDVTCDKKSVGSCWVWGSVEMSLSAFKARFVIQFLGLWWRLCFRLFCINPWPTNVTYMWSV